MDKIILKDSTEIQILEGSSTDKFQVEGKERDELIELCKCLTKENLSEYKILNSHGVISSIYKNRELSGSHIGERTEDRDCLLFTIELSPVSTIEKRLNAVEESQAVQDSAIMDIANVIGGE